MAKCGYEQNIVRNKTSLDIFWLKDKSLPDLDNLLEPDALAAEMIDNIEPELACFREIAGSL
jgi:type I restriction enzyme M protein